ncbi:MAG: hypothetical protein DRH90_09830 [Deltaproteobacteria bacterium]|nr:MAG: hypothetical protein DRH90_09830 [Deltaproteobacteria bacterium]RLC16923.1 MAG: hypothetical protein DRI24_07200 [Deltaproteobacteria bacterium]
MKILVVDDNKNILEFLEEFIIKLDHRVDLAQSYNSALSLIEKKEYNLVLLDKNFPDNAGNPEGGMTLLQDIKERFPSTEVIILTGYANINTAVEAIKLGAFDYISKPFEIDDLSEKIERLAEYKSFLSSHETLQSFKTLHNNVLSLLQNTHDLPEEQTNILLKKLGSRIDHVFGTQKEYEKIIKEQSEALEKIEYHAEFLKNTISEDSPYYTLIEKILAETKMRIWTKTDDQSN